MVFNREIEKKILEFIKNRPLGVTSSDIAHYLGLNRMTIAKYLAIIKERALVDFKQLGMAKLWYVPVTINKTDYFHHLLLMLADEMKDASGQKKVKKVAIEHAKTIESMYKNFYNVEKLSYSQVLDSLVDAQDKLGGRFLVEERTEDEIVLKCTKCPFGKKVKDKAHLCNTTSALCGVFTARNLGYSKVVLRETIARGAKECLIQIQLKNNEGESKEAQIDEYKSV